MSFVGVQLQRTFTASKALGQRALANHGGLLPLAPALGALALEEQNECREVAYDLEAVDRRIFRVPILTADLEHWAELLPPLVMGGGLGEGRTPTFPVSVAEVAGGSVIVKDESRNPTGTHKDRLARCVTSGVAWAGGRGLVVASSGNHAFATAAYSAAVGLDCIAVVTRGAPATLLETLNFYGAEVIETDRDNRWAITQKVVQSDGYAAATNLNSAYHMGHPFGVEGYKSIAYELVAEAGLPSVVSCPIGYGELFSGIVKGFQEMYELGIVEQLPLVVGCETATQPALSRTLQFDQWSPQAVEVAPTLALSIGTTIPGYRAWASAKAPWTRILAVSEQKMTAAREELARRGVFVEMSSAAAVAGLKDASCLYPEAFTGGPVVMVNTSTGFRDAVLA